MNVLIIGKDPTLFKSGEDVFSDTRTRHVKYTEELVKRKPGSSVRIITYSPAALKNRIDHIGENLTIYPTNSWHRVFFILGVIRIFLGMIQNWKPDLITVQTPYEEGFAAYFLSRLVKAKYLPQIHFDLFSEYWRKEHWLNGWRAAVSKWVIRRSAGVRVVSDALKKKIISELGIPEDKVYMVPVGVNFIPVATYGQNDRYKSEISPNIAGKPVVLFVGRFYDPKNLIAWVDVANGIRRQVADACFIMAGDGKLMPHVKKRITELGMEESFHLLGNIGHGKLPEVYAAADVFLLTSFYEGFGRVVVESYLSGIPVVSTRSTGPEELIEHGKTGFLCEMEDISGLADSVAGLLKDKELRLSMGQAGKRRIEYQFSFDILLEKLVSCWMKICG